MRKTILFIAAAAIGLAQSDSPVNTQSLGNANVGYTQIFAYSGANTIPTYICKARSIQDSATITVSAISNANPGVMTATTHGFYVSGSVAQSFVVFISGLTGGWVPLNGAHVLTPTGANSLSTDVDTTTFSTLTGTIVVTTKAPNAAKSYWSIESLQQDASGRLAMIAWGAPKTAAGGATMTNAGQLSGGSPAFIFPCAAPSAFQ